MSLGDAFYQQCVKRLLREAWQSEIDHLSEEALRCIEASVDELITTRGETDEVKDLIRWAETHRDLPFAELRDPPAVLVQGLSRLSALIGKGAVANRILSALPVNYTNQAWPNRMASMKAIIPQHFDRPIAALEVGTWFGLGSTPVWLDTLPTGSSLTLLDCWTSYLSETDLSTGHCIYRAMDDLAAAAFASAARTVRDAETRRPDLRITMIRGRSADVLAQMRAAQFDFIYVDASHYYADVKRDLIACKPLLRDSSSVLCGDDLELMPSPELLELARTVPDRDFIVAPDGRGFHPGVMLAVSEEIPRFEMKSGFWWATGFGNDAAHA